MAPLSDNEPADFASYWQETLEELARFPPVPEVDEIPLRSTDFATTYGVHLTSIGPYRIFGYLSIPRGNGPFPTRYYLPRYGSVVEPIPQGSANAQRREYITFAIGFRGQRLANQPFAASFPGLLTHEISDPAAYIFRGIAADCCRGLEYLAGRPEVDRERLVAIGSDLALVTAALCSAVTHLVCAPAPLLRHGGYRVPHPGVPLGRGQRLPALLPLSKGRGPPHPIPLRPAMVRPVGKQPQPGHGWG